jgi:hypothetical protein
MLPENNTGKDVEITERTQDLKGTKQYRTPNNKMRTSKATPDNYPTNKADPTIGSTRRKNRDRNPVGKPETPLTKSSISKYNGSEHSRLTKEKEQDDTKQADKINPSELSLMHNKQGPSPRNYPETIHHGDHAGRYKPKFDSPERNDDTHDTDYHSSHNYLSIPGTGLLITEFTQYEPITLLGATPTYNPETTKSPEERKDRTQIQSQQSIHYKKESVKITRARKTT